VPRERRAGLGSAAGSREGRATLGAGAMTVERMTGHVGTTRSRVASEGHGRDSVGIGRAEAFNKGPHEP
jgi:hypothetical protein